MKLIDKDALIAEIEKLKKSHDNWSCMGKCFHKEYENLLSFIGTLKVKEVDLNREMQAFAFLYLNPLKISDSNIGISITMAQLYRCAKHFFELGIKAQHSELTWEDISVLRKIMAEYRRQTSNEMLVLNDEDYCKEVLNRFKAQKGE